MPSEALSHQKPPAGTAALSLVSTAAAAVPHAGTSLRRRQWATKARTGCLGCRVRRVKCDERRPKCKSCTKRKTACHYELEPYDDPSPPRSDGRGQWLINTAQGKTASLSVSWDYKGYRLALAMNASEGPWCTGASLMEFTGPVPVWLIPEGWEALEAVHFHNTVIMKENNETVVAESTHQALARTEPYNPLNDIIIAGTLASRLAYIADLEDRDPMPTPATIHLWVRLRQLLSSSLQVISMDITDRDHIIEKKVLQRICDTAGLETYLRMPGARAHLRGFLALLRACGSPIELAKKQKGLGNAIHCMIIAAVVSNTASSHNDRFQEVSTFSHKDLLEVYSLTFESEFPCPSFLWARMLQISQLRELSATNFDVPLMRQRIEHILEQIDSFSAKNWSESYTIPEGRIATLFATIFRAATIIYCCSWCSASTFEEKFFDIIQHRINTQRIILLRHLGEAVLLGSGVIRGLMWPLAVAGYAVSSGKYAQRATVTRFLADMKRGEGPLPSMMLQRFQKFWLQSNQSWDDCWQEPLRLFL